MNRIYAKGASPYSTRASISSAVDMRATTVEFDINGSLLGVDDSNWRTMRNLMRKVHFTQ